MIEFFALSLVSLTAVIALAFGINYFMDYGPWRALGIAFFSVAVFLLFAATGLWEDASRYGWGELTPVFALMLVCGFLSIKYGRRFWLWLQKTQKTSHDK